MQQKNPKCSERKYTAKHELSSLFARKTPAKEPKKPKILKNTIKPRRNTPQNTTTKYSLHSLFLSLGFFAWWLFWAWASLQKSGANLHILWLGLPLWFWFSCVASLPLLWVASLFLLPEDADSANAQPQRTSKQPNPR